MQAECAGARLGETTRASDHTGIAQTDRGIDRECTPVRSQNDASIGIESEAPCGLQGAAIQGNGVGDHTGWRCTQVAVAGRLKRAAIDLNLALEIVCAVGDHVTCEGRWNHHRGHVVERWNCPRLGQVE